MYDNLLQDSISQNLVCPEKGNLILNRRRAERIVLLAQKKGEIILKETENRAQQIRREAYEQGHKEGYEQGIKQGCTRGEEDYKKSVEEIYSDLLEAEKEYEKHLQRLLNSLEPRIIDMVMLIAKAVLKREIENDDELITRTIRDAAQNLSHRDTIVLSVHRSEIQNVTDERNDLISSSDFIIDMEVAPSKEIGKGGCIISSPTGIVDARIESQMEVISDLVND